MNKWLHPYFILFLLFFLFMATSNYIWLGKSNSINGVDSQNHLFFSIKFFYDTSDIIKSNISLWGKIINIIKLVGTPVRYSSVYWPNGLNLIASIMCFLFGKSLFAAKLSLFPYLFILLISTYLIGRLLYSDFVGLLATFIIFMYPIIFESSRQFQLDFPLTAMVTLNILFLIKCNYFKDRRYSFFFGFSLGWSMLIKGQVILFTIWPLLWVLYKTFTNSGRENLPPPIRSKQLQNIVIFVIVAGLIASVWWGHQIGDAVGQLKVHIFSKQKNLESSIFPWEKKYSFDSIFFHLWCLFYSSLRPFLFSVFFIFFPFFLKQKIKYKGIYLIWLIIPFLLFSLVFSIKHSRFLMPILPVMALITAWGIGQIKSKKIKFVILCLIISFTLAQFYILSYGDYKYRDISIGPFKIFGRNGFGSGYEVGSFHKLDLKIDEVANIIKAHQPFGQPVKIGSIICNDRPGCFEVLYWLKLKDRSLDPIDLTEQHASFLENFNSLDFILISLPLDSSLQWPGGEEFRFLLRKYSQKTIYLEAKHPIKWEQLLRALENSKSDFQLVGSVLPDTGDIIYYIYKRIYKVTN